MNEQELIQDYINGMKTKDMAKKYSCSTNTISKIIDKNGIPRRAKKANRNKDLSKFYSLDSPDTQYWLGYICADGNIQYDCENRMYKVSLFSKDIEVIEAFISYFGKDIVGTHRRKQNMVYEVYICSKELCKYLVEELNIVPNKSLVLNPNISYTSHFIRGYFDGDGWVRKPREYGRHDSEAKITSGSIEFLNKVQKCLENVGIKCSVTPRKECNASDLHIYNKENVIKLFNFLYKDANSYLKRKYDIFVALQRNL